MPQYHRFASPDPGRDQHLEDPQSWNLYTYVRNNPTMMVDANGQDAYLFYYASRSSHLAVAVDQSAAIRANMMNLSPRGSVIDPVIIAGKFPKEGVGYGSFDAVMEKYTGRKVDGEITTGLGSLSSLMFKANESKTGEAELPTAVFRVPTSESEDATLRGAIQGSLLTKQMFGGHDNCSDYIGSIFGTIGIKTPSTTTVKGEAGVRTPQTVIMDVGNQRPIEPLKGNLENVAPPFSN